MEVTVGSGMHCRHAHARAAGLGSTSEKTEMARFSAVSKHFAGVTAVDEVSLVSHSGTVHAVTGENGAGKSTLMKMLAGVHTPDGGTIQVDGSNFNPHDPREAQALGVSTIYQELNLIPNLTVAENLFFGREPRRLGLIDRRALVQQSKDLLDKIGLSLDPTRPCGDLTIAEQQFVEIAKGISHDAKIYIFDEPTAALNTAESEQLFDLIENLRAESKLVYYISHRLDEIFRLSDVITVMKDGCLSANFKRGETDEAGLIQAMVGRDLGDYFPMRNPDIKRPTKMKVDRLKCNQSSPEVSFELRAGEILGLAGLEGQGQRGIIRALVGLEPPVSGSVTLEGERVTPERGIVSTVRSGLGFVPEDRKTEGLFLKDSIERNVSLGFFRCGSLFSRARRGQEAIEAVNQRMRLKSAGLSQFVVNLSGGNQQKVMLARWLVSGVQVLVVEEPTRGVDVGAKAEIYNALREFCDDGCAILITSSEMNEVIGLCDRILVVRGGEITAEIAGHDATEESVLQFAITDKKKVI
ncbi:sugar ABC transporter ATP-binding protein [Lentibacter sp. XHP0401]|uniref:sugar ABC transporter ATP-binding protein n=1 Tax=Lentibacter sp. XHP0401 TaxID=2984334 RepID=UPI0021E81C2B|nr:sugar ABC transporter ATP-binding protein [Lentibacter sp. XHP0401]MCV2894651.1 sugar ABC transporter ATP-binding protein [Lentibacter sp. XHP0401]